MSHYRSGWHGGIEARAGHRGDIRSLGAPSRAHKGLFPGYLFILGSGVAAAGSIVLVGGPEGLGVSMSIILLAVASLQEPSRRAHVERDLGDPAFLAGSIMFVSFGLRGLGTIASLLPYEGPGADLPDYGTFTPTDALVMCLVVAGWLAFVVGLPSAHGSNDRQPAA